MTVPRLETGRSPIRRICNISCMSLNIPEDVISRQSLEAQAIIRALIAEVAELKSHVIGLQAEVTALKLEFGRQNGTPQNSLLPLSTQHRRARPPSTRGKSKKNREWWPGHPRRQRAVIPAEECHEVVTLKPEQCRRCGTILTGDDASRWRHQVWKLPEIKPIVTEFSGIS